MLRPFEQPAPGSPWIFPPPVFRVPSSVSRLRHDPEAAVTRPRGLAGIFLGAVTITPLMEAIAQAEGFNVAGSIPQQANNPGDLVLGNIGNGTLGTAGITVFGSVDDGWAALANQINLIVSGGSAYYSPMATLAQVGTTWSGSAASTWANNVASILGVSLNTPFAALAGGAIASIPGSSPGTIPSTSPIPTPYLVGGAAMAVLLLVAAVS